MVCPSDICIHKLPALKVAGANKLADFHDASREDPKLFREALINALLAFEIDQHILTRIQLGDCFRRSLQAQRQTTPYRLHTIVAECKSGTLDEGSLEARFYAHGGVRAVTALAAAATDEKNVVKQLKGLPDSQLQSFFRTVDIISPHRDFLFIVETVDRKKPARLSKRKHLPEPRSRRRLQERHNADGLQQERLRNLPVESHRHRHNQDSRINYGETGNFRLLDESDSRVLDAFPPSKRKQATNTSTESGTCCASAFSPRGTPDGQVAAADDSQPMTNMLDSGTAPGPLLTFAPCTSGSGQAGRSFTQYNEFSAAISTNSPGVENNVYGRNVNDCDFEHYGIDLDSFTAL
ncbi:hypothetical protein TMatcc_001765 [Talaromyces marneffei ATCC 18224]|uniref:Uncharacterized protein n=2 Tax=Talaromyces marneffei TaxID=37727 RepID=B6QHQ6_TALMQ|nr:uncharacterized protein EYB26_007036 [Talaromyces marneffei]EEA22901.1 hypothetical protein PMAA_095060 [Talaromyces marneffei ATCC 18224]KAE8551780.1 hypothetical protein EYB25_005670 [Talaromyces marneffei]QGA19347.1 hypothetical protein EYB26_007036 [Talaromyces marneffei]